MAKNDQVVRVGFGSSQEPVSSVYRFWAHKNDAYLSARHPGGGIIKLSLHERDWIVAWIKAPKPGSRRLSEIPRPTELAPGWTLGPSVCVLRPDDKHLPKLPEPDKEIVWIEAPPIGCAGLLRVLLSNHGDTLPVAIVGAAQPVGYVDFDNGERAWLLHDGARLTAAQISEAATTRERFNFKVKVGPGKSFLDEVGGSGFEYPDVAPGEPFLIEYPFGPQNFEEDTS